MLTLLKSAVQLQLTDFRSHGGLGKLRRGVHEVINTVTRLHRIDDLKVQHAIYLHSNIILGDTGLGCHINGNFLQGVFICYTIQKRYQDMESGIQCLGIFPQAFDDECRLLRNNFCRFENGENHQCHYTNRYN